MKWCLPRLYSTGITKNSVTQTRFKETMSRVSNSVSIVTAAVGIDQKQDTYHGLTISSMTSLALNPFPLIQFNLKLPSFTSESLHKYGYFGVHLLGSNERAVKLANQFSKGARQCENGLFERTKPFIGLKEGADFETHYIKHSEFKIPLLKYCRRILICKKVEVFRIGDHEIWVGKVNDIIINDVHDSDHGGLLHYNRGFHKLGDNILSNDSMQNKFGITDS
ncbi:hypothetical protein NCAS_0E01090 [Naumovozyma castellii]|uniref:Flavin reductase like domain-containing protein n=1 Tax=Naumovozyma castellii TaxID=27288 RepID=G0VFB4_NAUCA|nr:hypothetical protein NCAS_0E01090 [Naumovozyma castellii CBS 4309]CCC70179.1 hypothetical protein NCAS_0E01090 [Naumovozyma castellii CBS 4309]